MCLFIDVLDHSVNDSDYQLCGGYICLIIEHWPDLSFIPLSDSGWCRSLT